MEDLRDAGRLQSMDQLDKARAREADRRAALELQLAESACP